MTSAIHGFGQPDFHGLTVASFESRMAVEMARLIGRYGGKSLVVPALREIPLEDNSAALEFGMRLMTERIDMLILLTGAGTSALFDLLRMRYSWPSIVEALARTAIVARGPKPAAALRALALKPTATVPEPNTWVDVVRTVDEHLPVKGLRVAVQEYGMPNPALHEALQRRGAAVFQVPIYKWALPDDLVLLRRALENMMAGEVAVLLITNAAQVDHVMQVLELDGKVEFFRSAVTKMVVASIGPTTSERLRYHGWPVDFEPSHSKMGILVKELSEQIYEIIEEKR